MPILSHRFLHDYGDGRHPAHTQNVIGYNTAGTKGRGRVLTEMHKSSIFIFKGDRIMAILALFTGQGYTKEMYEILRKEVDWEHKKAPGGMFHVASFDKSGNTIHVADVWESENHLNNFVETRLMPVMQKHKMPPPKVEIYHAYNINAYPEINKHVLKF